MIMVSKREQLWQDIRVILFTQWDPIGINNIPECENDYDSYIPGIIRILNSDADEYKMLNHLRKLETGSMGLSDSNTVINKHIVVLLRQLR